MMVPLNVSPAINALSSVGIAYDTYGSRVDLKWQETPTPDYTFVGRVSGATAKDLRILRQGNISGAAIVIHTNTGPLRYSDSTPSGATEVQTYVRHQGSVYKVLEDFNRVVQGNHHRYLAILYKERS